MIGDPSYRARLVEDLRLAASLLADSSPGSAERLTELAQQLCEHVRQSPAGACRYCDLLVSGVLQ